MFRHAASVLLLFSWLLVSEGVSAEDRQYNRDVRPILLDACFSCHGPDSASRKADLRLDQFEAAVAAKAIVPGDPQSSEIMRRIQSTDPDVVMPPPAFRKTLTDAQKQTLADWISSGAKYQQHWSFLPPEPREPPAIPAELAARFPEWTSSPIDAFVLDRLQAHGLTPAPAADRRRGRARGRSCSSGRSARSRRARSARCRRRVRSRAGR